MKKENINKQDIIAKISPIIEAEAEKLGLTILEIDLVEEFQKWHVRIFIYSSEHMIAHKDCQDLTKAIEDALEELIPFDFYLEVSSPGTDKKLKSSKEYSIFTGEKVSVKLRYPLENGQKAFMAIIEGYNDEEGLSLKLLDDNEIVKIDQKNITSIKLNKENI